VNKQNWQEVEFAQPLGMVTNVNNPGRKSAQLLLNVHTHDKIGRLNLRPGYALKYPAPSDPTITNSTFLNFEMFMDKQAVPAGQEITCVIQKGIIVPISGSGLSSANNQNALCFWIRPYWNGSAWIDDWQWLNRIIITNITTGGIPNHVQNQIDVFGDAAQGLGTDSLVGWTIYNAAQDQFARVITSTVDGTNTRIVHTNYNSVWNANDVVIIMQSYYDLTCLAEIYNCAASDIVFHKVNDDLRIGFGGQANRTGIAIGFRNTSLLLNNFNFDINSADLTSEALTAFASINKVILEPFIPDISGYGINTMIIEGSLPVTSPASPTYYLNLTVMLDGYEEILVDSTTVYLQADQGIQLNPYVTPGHDSLRATSLRLYAGADGITYYQIFEYFLRNISNAVSVNNSWQINNSGLTLLAEPTELYTEANAATIADEENTIGSWAPYTAGVELLTVDTPGAGNSAYSIKVAVAGGNGGIFPLLFGNYGNYFITLYLKASIVMEVYVAIFDENMTMMAMEFFNVTTSFTQFQTVLGLNTGAGTPAFFAIYTFNPNTDFWFDLISIKANALTNYTSPLQNGIEMSDSLGYTPGASLVKGWDQALVFHSSTYFLNPYVDQRYDGFIYVSIINSANSFMWDIATADNYRELDTFESYEVIGMILLPTMELLILMNNCITAIDPDTGVARNPVFEIGAVSRESIVNINGIIFWCGNEDIYMLDINAGLNPITLLENTIRDLYQALVNKNLLFCLRDEYNTYRVRTVDKVNKTEFLLSKNGWVEEQKYDYPEIYRLSAGTNLNFLSQGNIYQMNTEITSTGNVATDDNNQAVSDDSAQVLTDGQ